MNTAEYITALIAGKVLDLAVLGAVYGGFRLVAPRLSLAAVKQQPQTQQQREKQPDPAQAPAAEPGTAPIPLRSPA